MTRFTDRLGHSLAGTAGRLVGALWHSIRGTGRLVHSSAAAEGRHPIPALLGGAGGGIDVPLAPRWGNLTVPWEVPGA